MCYDRSRKIVQKIKHDTGVECISSTFRRTYAGYWQKRLGQFLWEMDAKGLSYTIGSTQSATELVKSNCKLELEGNEIFGEIIK